VLLCGALLLGGCGGGGGGGGSSSVSIPQSNTPNSTSISVDAGPTNGINQANIPYVTVTVCVPGSTSCQTIDHVIVDTGSSGLRILSSALNLALPQQTDGNGSQLAECMQFADGYSWGSLRTADLKIAGEQASNLNMQVIDGSFAGGVPSACSNSGGVEEDTVAAFGGNGILGIAVFQQDCGGACVNSASLNAYFACPNGSNCQPTTRGLAQQVQNPVALFSADSNGTLIKLPSVPANGAGSATGSLIFGIGTQSNNALGSAAVYTLNNNGNFTTTYNSTQYTGFLDSGSNALFFKDAITRCAGSPQHASALFYCPSGTLHLSASIQGHGGNSSTIPFDVANADSLLINNSNNTAFNNLAGFNNSQFDWGLPFFYGRSVFTAIEGKAVPGGSAPYVAF
jgi:hypothetical protein